MYNKRVIHTNYELLSTWEMFKRDGHIFTSSKYLFENGHNLASI